MIRRLAPLLLMARAAAAQDSPPPPAAPAPAAPAIAQLPPEVLERLRRLEERDDRLSQRVQGLERASEETQRRVSALELRLGGYIDFGFFYVQGDGSGVRPDYGHAHYSQYSDVPDSWVLLGDPLSTAVNSRGEPADTGASRALQFDSIGNRGVSSFILNAVDLRLDLRFDAHFAAMALVDLIPRGRDPSDPSGIFLGDFLELKLAYGEYLSYSDRYQFTLQAGKVDSVLGIEYRDQEADRRIGVTPSLICRYTCGRPLGLRAKLRVLDDLFTIAIALSNGSSIASTFPLQDQIDVNNGKTISGRIASKLPTDPVRLEVGASGAFGSQDNQPDSGVHQYHYGFDLSLGWRDFELRAEYVRGRADGNDASARPPCQLAACLTYQGAYGLLLWRATNWLWPYFRVDWRDALFQAGALPSGGGNFVYVSRVVRATLGIHLDISRYLAVKAEYTFNRELNLPDFPDDVLTSSLVMRY